MIENLVKFYKDNVIAYSLVYKNMRISYFVMLASFTMLHIVTFLLIINGLFFFIFSSNGLLYKFFTFLFALMFFFIMISVVNSKAKKILRKKLKLKSVGFAWRTEEFERLQTQILSDHLKDKKLYSKTKLEKLIEMLSKDIERRKIPVIVPPSIFIALFTPIWIQLLTYVFKQANTQELMFSYFVGFTALIILSMICLWIGGRFYKSLFEFVIITEFNLKKVLLIQLEEMLLQFDDESE